MKNRRINDARCMCEYNVRYVTNLKAKAAFTAPRYDNLSNYGKKNEVTESCPEFNAE